MTAYKVVVDGSNVATEGRSLPSLGQLDEAVRAFIEEHPGADVLVIVDSSFPNRIDPKEVATFESAYNAGEIITPPAGTIGRGDSFILKVADKLGATIFSNDSFQEFHGTYDWLFDTGRLVGGKPIPGLGWVFMPRTPVRGPKSREAVRESKRSQVRIGSPEAMKPMPVPKAPPKFTQKTTEEPRRSAESRARDPRSDDQRQKLPTQPNEPNEARGKKRRRRRGGAVVSGGRVDAVVGDAINDPMTFLTFLSGNLVGSSVEGIVETYSSHGFYVTAAAARCYVQLSGVSVPAPRSAKEVVRKGESRTFVVVGFDNERRGIELALEGTLSAASATGEMGEPSSGEAVVIDTDDAAVTPGRGKRGGRQQPGANASSKRLPKKAAAAMAVASPADVSTDATATSGDRPTKSSKAAKAAALKPTATTPPAAKRPGPKKASATKLEATPSDDAEAPVAVERGQVKVAKRVASDVKLSKSTANKPPAPLVLPKAPLTKTSAKKAAAKTLAPAPASVPSKAVGTAAKPGRVKALPAKAVAAKSVPAKVASNVSPAKAVAAKSVPAKAASNVSPAKVVAPKAAAAKPAATKAAAAKPAVKTTRAAKK